jgi:hypothetical protein
VKSVLAVVASASVVMLAAACGSDSATAPKPPVGPDAASCTVGTISTGQTISGDLSAAPAAGCTEPLFWDSTFTVFYESYNFGVQSGKGYLVSLLSTWDSHVELEGGTTGAEVQLGEADYSAPYQSTIPFVANATTAYSLRVGQDDQSPAADTGAFTLRVQSCKVPIGTVTDSVSHTDSLTASDCTDPQSDFETDDSSHIHIYTIHFATAGDQRMLYVDVPSGAITFEGGGPGYDPYCYFCSAGWGHGNVSSGSYVMTAGDSGTYTMIVGTPSYDAGTQPYTLTFGAETVAGPLHVTPPPGARSLNFTSVNASTSPARKKHKH